MCNTISSSKLNYSQLPTNTNIVAAILREKSKDKNTEIKKIIKSIAREVEEIWQQTSIPIISQQRIIVNIENLYESYKKLVKWQGKAGNKYDEKKIEFKSEHDAKLFDICSRKCLDNCHCPYDKKVPKSEKEFIRDQRTKRKLCFGKIDKVATEKDREKRSKQEKYKTKETVKKSSQRKEPLSRPEPIQLTPLPSKKSKLINVATVLNAKGVLYRLGTTICNALLKDMDMRSENNIIDPTRMFNAKKKSREMVTNHHKLQLKSFVETAKIFALFFDGKKDETFTLVANEETNHLHQRIQKQDHYTILFQPGDHFYSHLTPNGSAAVNAAQSIYDSLIKDEIDIAKLFFVLEENDIFEPLITKLRSDSELKDCVECKTNAVSELIESIPLHSQAVERAVKMVSEASSQANGEENRNGIIHSKVALRQILKSNSTKSDFTEFMAIDLFSSK